MMKVTTKAKRKGELQHTLTMSDSGAFNLANALQAQMMQAIEMRDAARANGDNQLRHAWHMQAMACSEACAKLYRVCGYSKQTIQDAILPEEFRTAWCID